MNLKYEILFIRKNAEKFREFVQLSKKLLEEDNKHIKFILGQFVKFVIAKKIKNEFLDFAKYLFERSNHLPIYLLYFILCENTRTDTKEYLKILSQNGWIYHMYFIVKFDHRRITNCIDDRYTSYPKTNNVLAINYANIILKINQKTLKFIDTIEDKDDVKIYIKINRKLGIKYADILRIENSQLYTLICILLLIDSENKLIHIICDLYKHLVKHIILFNFVGFFKFLIEFDLYVMIKIHCEIIFHSLHYVHYCFKPVSRGGQIPDEELNSILQNASPRVRKIYSDMKFQITLPDLSSDICEYIPYIRNDKIPLPGILPSDICEYTNLPTVLSHIIAEYIQFNVRHI
jgi:hypothetical protein